MVIFGGKLDVGECLRVSANWDQLPVNLDQNRIVLIVNVQYNLLELILKN